MLVCLLACFLAGAFALAKEVAPYMLSRGGGTIIYTSATAAYRGNAGQHAHTMAMAGRRHLAQSLNNELGPQGIHVAHVNIDGMVNVRYQWQHCQPPPFFFFLFSYFLLLLLLLCFSFSSSFFLREGFVVRLLCFVRAVGLFVCVGG